MKKEKNVTNRQWNKINTVYYYIIKEFIVRTIFTYSIHKTHFFSSVNFLSQTRGIIQSYGICAHQLFQSQGTSVRSFNPFPPVATEIPAYTQKVNTDFLSKKRGIILQKSHSKLWDLSPSAKIIIGNKCVKFQSIPFRSNRDTSLHAKTKCRFSKSKKGHNSAKKSHSKLWDLSPSH